jgi:hypothetical protein
MAVTKDWLSGATAERHMTMWALSARVGNVRNNDPSLIEPIKLTAA